MKLTILALALSTYCCGAEEDYDYAYDEYAYADADAAARAPISGVDDVCRHRLCSRTRR